MTRSKSSRRAAPLGNHAFLLEKFACPITHEVMRRPVTAADGMVYDQDSVETWLRTCVGAPRSPSTGAPMAPQFTTAYLIRDLMAAHKTARSALLPPTHGVVRVSKAPDTRATAHVDAPAPRPRPFDDGRHAFTTAGFLLSAAATGALSTACLGHGLAMVGWMGQQEQPFGLFGAFLGTACAVLGVASQSESQVLAALGAVAGASVGTAAAVVCALVALLAVHDGVYFTADFASNHPAVCSIGTFGMLGGAAQGYQAACRFGRSVLRLPDVPGLFGL